MAATSIEELRVKFCVRCDSGFEAGDNIIQYEGALFHVGCFYCGGPCRKHLDVKSLLWTRQGLPWCKSCYSHDMERMCRRCGKAIRLNNDGVIEGFCVGDFDFHKDCYSCNKCKKQFGAQDDGSEAVSAFELDGEAYCKECATGIHTKTIKKKPKSKWGNKCAKCKKSDPPARVLDMNGKIYHIGCQPCRRCKISVREMEYVLEARRAYCKPCAEATFLTKCGKCHMSVEIPKQGQQARHIRTAMGVYHESCFKCHNCFSGLLVDGKSLCFPVGKHLFCADCKGEAEAKLIAETAPPEYAEAGAPTPSLHRGYTDEDTYEVPSEPDYEGVQESGYGIVEIPNKIANVPAEPIYDMGNADNATPAETVLEDNIYDIGNNNSSQRAEEDTSDPIYDIGTNPTITTEEEPIYDLGNNNSEADMPSSSPDPVPIMASDPVYETEEGANAQSQPYDSVEHALVNHEEESKPALIATDEYDDLDHEAVH